MQKLPVKASRRRSSNGCSLLLTVYGREGSVLQQAGTREKDTMAGASIPDARPSRFTLDHASKQFLPQRGSSICSAAGRDSLPDEVIPSRSAEHIECPRHISDHHVIYRVLCTYRVLQRNILRLFHSREPPQKIPKDAFNSLWGLFWPRFVTFFRLQRRLKTDFGLVQKQPNKHYLVKIVTEYGKNRPF